MTKRQLDDTLSTVKPYAVFGRNKKRDIYLHFNQAAAEMCQFVHRERVDLFFDRKHSIWDISVLTIKKGGTQRSVFKISSGHPSWWRISVTRLIKQFDISVLSHRLSILDYIDKEIYIDLSRKSEEELDREKLWKSRTGRRARITLTIRGQKEIVISTNIELLNVINALAKKERKTRTKFILDAVRFYIEDKYEF